MYSVVTASGKSCQINLKESYTISALLTTGAMQKPYPDLRVQITSALPNDHRGIIGGTEKLT